MRANRKSYQSPPDQSFDKVPEKPDVFNSEFHRRIRGVMNKVGGGKALVERCCMNRDFAYSSP